MIREIKRYVKKKTNRVYSVVQTTNYDSTMTGKIIIVTGGNSGIGKATAKLLVESGAQVIIVGRKEVTLRQTAQELGENCLYIQQDLATMTDDSKLITDIKNLLGGKNPDCLVNCAGIYVSKEYWEYSSTDFDNMTNINAKSVYFLSRAFAKNCILNNIKGKIVMVNSDRGLFGDLSPYGMGKEMIQNYTKGMAREFIQYGIRVNAVCPGMVATAINNVDVEGNLSNSTRGGRIFLPEEIAEVIKFLLSDISNCINGAIIPCDEGEYLR